MQPAGFACLLINNSRSKAYIQKLLSAGLAPSFVIYAEIGREKKPDAGAIDSQGEMGDFIRKAFADRKYFLYDPALKGNSLSGTFADSPVKYATFDPGECVLATCEKHGIEHVRLEAPDINAPEIISALAGRPEQYVVFAGGGILKMDILSLGKRFIHCHPGWLPSFRGSHCIEWSILLSDCCGVSALEMNQQIDGGRVCERFRFEYPELEDGGIPPLYSAHIRSEALVKVMSCLVSTGRLEYKPAVDSPERMFYKMHPAITNLVFDKLLSGRKSPKATVFVDRDGTINVNKPFPNVSSPDELHLLDNSAEGLRLMNDAGLRIIVITNQAGINNPENPLDWDKFDRITNRLDHLIAEKAGAGVLDTFCCPHQAVERCDCRKPATGLYRYAARRYPDIELTKTYVVGDRTDDMLAGRKIGAKTVLVLTGHGPDTMEQLEAHPPDFIAQDLLDAARVILDDIK